MVSANRSIATTYLIYPTNDLLNTVNDGAAGDIFIVMPGTHVITNQIELKDNQVLFGGGMGISTIQFDYDKTKPINADLRVVNSGTTVTNVLVSSLTLDCNTVATNVPSRKRMSIYLQGSKSTIQYVESKGAYGQTGTGECFTIKIAQGKTGTGSLIEHCRVVDVVGNWHSAIGMHGEGTIQYCAVYFPRYVSGVFHQAYNCEDADDLVLRSNYADGGTTGYYADYGVYDNLTLTNNVFTNVVQGVHFWLGTDFNANGLYFYDNDIYLDEIVATNSWTEGFNFYVSGASDSYLDYIELVGNRVLLGNGASVTGRYVQDVDMWTDNNGSIWYADYDGNTFTTNGLGSNWRKSGNVNSVTWGTSEDNVDQVGNTLSDPF